MIKEIRGRFEASLFAENLWNRNFVEDDNTLQPSDVKALLTLVEEAREIIEESSRTHDLSCNYIDGICRCSIISKKEWLRKVEE